MDPTHPAVTILNDLFGPEWNAVDLLVRDDQAAIVEMRRVTVLWVMEPADGSRRPSEPSRSCRMPFLPFSCRCENVADRAGLAFGLMLLGVG